MQNQKLDEMLQDRLRAIAVLDEATGVKRRAERQITEEIFRLGMFDFLNVDWRRLSREFHLPERPGHV